MNEQLVKNFSSLFSGSERNYLMTTELNSVGSKNGDKLEAETRMIHHAPPISSWRQHLAGDDGLGVVPIRDDGTVSFGAIDIDDYSIDHSALVGTVEEAGLPLVVCRTKSGGAHLYLFLCQPTAAVMVKDKLTEWSRAVGHEGAEVFPKQVSLEPGDHGNGINLPYFGGENSRRYALRKKDGKCVRLTPEGIC